MLLCTYEPFWKHALIGNKGSLWRLNFLIFVHKLFQKRYFFSENLSPDLCWFLSPSVATPTQPCWSGVPTVPDSVAPGFAALKTSTEKWSKKSPRTTLYLRLSPSKILHWEHICKLWSWISRLTVLMNIGQKLIIETENFSLFFSLVWLCGPLWSTEVVERLRLAKGRALGNRSCCFSVLSWMQLQIKKNKSEKPQWFAQDFHPRWENPYETVWVFCFWYVFKLWIPDSPIFMWPKNLTDAVY